MATDFDFDEIDKAVNGALGGDTPAEVQPDVSAAPVSSMSAPANAEKPANSASNPASRRSSGRFMDMVHPSSDMKNGSAGSVDTVANPGVRRPAPTPAASTESVGTSETDTWNQPLDSPFLPDAVVEKRPLGGAAPTQHDFDALELLEAPDDPKIEAHTMPDPIDFAEQSAKAKDSVAVEPTAELSIPEVQPEATKESQPVFTPEFNNTPSADTASEAADSTVSQEVSTQGPGYGDGSFQPIQDETEPVGPTSIQQQYKEQPSSSPESGAIFDTEAYHKPLVPVAKKKSGILVVLWILLLVAFGGGMGAAVYFFVLPML